MEVKPGYKQTEVGVIPEDWDVQNGEQITILIGKGGSPRWQGFEYSNTGMLFVTSENVRDGFLDIREPKYLPLAFHEKLKRTKLQKHDILVNLVGASIGRSCQIQQELGEANVNQAVAVFRVKDEHSSAFLACCFQAPTTIERILEMQVDAARPNISLGDLRRFPIQLPPLPEQRAIATALSDVDALLGGLDRLIAKKHDLKQAAMQQLLTGQTRLPGFHAEWEVKQLGDVASLSKGTQLHSSEADDGGKFAHLNGGITPSNYTHKSNTAGNTIAISEGGNSCGFVQFMPEPYWCGGHCYSVMPKGVDNYFLYQALKAQQSAIMGLRVGSGLPNVQKTGLLAFKIHLPSSPPEQTAIASVLTDMDGELAALEQRREKTRALKQAIMQELLTGTTRLI